MFCRNYLWQLAKYIKYNKATFEYHVNIKFLHNSSVILCQEKNKNENKEEKGLVEVKSFEHAENKSKNTYLQLVDIYLSNNVHRRGHVEFIHTALKHMKTFGVNKDLESYKALLDVLPKGKFIPTNVFQSEFMHYPKQQQCAIDLLEQMEDNGVCPDVEMEDMLMNIFGRRGYPLRKYWRMMYWMPKFKNLSPWPVPNPPPNDAFELAKMAIQRISSVDLNSQLSVYQAADIPDSIDDTWIVSSQSPTQKEMLAAHDKSTPVYIEGAFRVWLRNQSVNYFIMRTSPQELPDYIPPDFDNVSNIQVPALSSIPTKVEGDAPAPSVHVQEDGTIYALCATGSSSKDSLLSWVRHLEKENPALKEYHIVFTIRSGSKEVAVATEKNESQGEIVDK